MTDEQRQMSNHWAMWGSDGFPIRPVKSGWVIDPQGVWTPLGIPPSTVFKTKKAAIKFVSKLCMIRFNEWQAQNA